MKCTVCVFSFLAVAALGFAAATPAEFRAPFEYKKKAPEDDKDALAKALTLHASFDKALDADFSRGDKKCYVQQGKELVQAKTNDDVKVEANAGRFGGAPRIAPRVRDRRTGSRGWRASPPACRRSRRA